MAVIRLDKTYSHRFSAYWDMESVALLTDSLIQLSPPLFVCHSGVSRFRASLETNCRVDPALFWAPELWGIVFGCIARFRG